MISIQTNVNSLVAQQNLSVNSAFQAKTIQQLTSGYRINSSGDDAAGLAVANKFRNSIAELTQGVANGNDATAQLQIMDGGMTNISQMLDRLKTLAMQSASGAFSGGVGGRVGLNKEFQNTITEIDRQAESIGLNTGGTFAKSLSVYLGAGSGSQSAANSVVSVDLSKSMVDTQSLGLKGVQAVNSATYDLGSASATSVQNIMADSANLAGGNQAKFIFRGSGFSNDDTTGAAANDDGVEVTVNLNGVSDTTGLVKAINDAIQSVGDTSNTGVKAALKAANVTASIATDSNGNQKLAFSSSNSAFEVQANDKMANALLGNIDGSGGTGTTAATGQAAELVFTAATAKLTYTAGHVLSIAFAGGGTTSGTRTWTADTASTNATEMLADLQNFLATDAGTKNAGISASLVNGYLQIHSKNNQTALTVTTAGADVADLGFGAAGAKAADSISTFATLTSSGAYQLGTTSSTGAVSATDFDFVSTGNSTQSITIAANDASGSSHSKTVNLSLTNASTAKDVVASINAALQQTNDDSLKQVTAVVKNVNGVSKINFVSNVPGFTVSVGKNSATTGTGAIDNTRGMYLTDSADATKAIQGKTFDALKVGSGGSSDISSQAGAEAAVTAITEAVAALGSAQAAIGKGQNALGYAISLASSQITNFSAAEAQIRDTNVAQQAANLSKAQTLSQASIAAMAQANSAPQAVLSLLRG